MAWGNVWRMRRKRTRGKDDECHIGAKKGRDTTEGCTHNQVRSDMLYKKRVGLGTEAEKEQGKTLNGICIRNIIIK